MEKLLIIDSNSLINRAFYGVHSFLSAPDGTPTNAIYGFLMTLLKIIDEQKPDYIFAAFDLKAPTFRHKLYDGYKAQRKPMPDDLAAQMQPAKDLLDKMGIARLELAGFEADDIIGTVAAECARRKIKCLVATGDKDDLQLAGDFCSILLTSTKNGVTATEEYTPARVFERYGVTPSEFIDVKALMGDPSDNIPGVAGIGEKTAVSLIAKFKSIDRIYEKFDENGFTGAQERKLREGKDMAYLSKTLATIDTAVPIELDFDSARGTVTKTAELRDALTALGLMSIIKRLDFSGVQSAAPAGENPIEGCTKSVISDPGELSALCEKLLRADEISLIFDLDNDKIRRIGIACGKDGCSVEANADALRMLAPVFAAERPAKICFNAKEAICALAPQIHLNSLAYDVAIAAYLINSAKSGYSIDSLCIEHFGRSFTEGEESSQISMFDDEEAGADENIATRALLLAPLRDKTLALLEKNGQHKLYFDIELPLVGVLADMQLAGMYVDKGSLAAFGEHLGGRIGELEQEIYALAGGKFNINSPKQLGEILFDRLGLKHGRKKKTGYSTSAEILEELAFEHPIVPLVLEYRKAAKLKSTYCDALAASLSPEDGRIHSVFNQTVTVTGRLSSTEPNLQNSPTRTELGREIRRMFVAPEGRILVDADYSQIELRVLAAMADDAAMRDAFLSGRDIHTETAAQVLKIPSDSVTKEQRSGAKAVNFGIVYGIGEFSLAKDLKISVAEARAYIADYLEHYSGVRDFMDKTKAFARENGYVKTLFNRIRYIPELRVSNYNTRMFGERAAMNAPIQGTAADIIKLAMVRVHARLSRELPAARLILQVHDELIVEAAPADEQAVRKILKEEMEGAAQIGVPLKADIESGRSWYDCK